MLKRIMLGAGATLAGAADLALSRNLSPKPRSGRQEWLENLVNRP